MAVKSFAVKGNFPLGIEAERNPPFNFSRSNCHSTHRPTRLSLSLYLFLSSSFSSFQLNGDGVIDFAFLQRNS